MRTRTLIAAVALGAGVLTTLPSCHKAGNAGAEAEADSVATYANPVLDLSMPDPTVIKADDGHFYLFATENTRNVPIMRSDNLVDWTSVGTAFTDETRPTFVKDGGIWAPDINKVGDKYVLFYAMSTWGGEWECGIGRAVSDKPEGPYTDLGKLFISSEMKTQNSIDPFYIEDGGHKYLFWGSFSGIWYIELTTDGTDIMPDAKPTLVAGTAYEGVYVHQHEGMYYLFASTGTCCEGLKSTYQTVVGRSESLFGPYVDRKGEKMLDNHHEILIHKNEAFVGTGHNSEIVTDNEGQDWIFYHAFLASDPDRGRVLMLDPVDWKDGWPVVKDQMPAAKAKKPSF